MILWDFECLVFCCILVTKIIQKRPRRYFKSFMEAIAPPCTKRKRPSNSWCRGSAPSNSWRRGSIVSSHRGSVALGHRLGHGSAPFKLRHRATEIVLCEATRKSRGPTVGDVEHVNQPQPIEVRGQEGKFSDVCLIFRCLAFFL